MVCQLLAATQEFKLNDKIQADDFASLEAETDVLDDLSLAETLGKSFSVETSDHGAHLVPTSAEA